VKGGSVAATLSAALASCRKHLVLTTRALTNALSIPTVHEAIDELLERGCKICILVTHPSEINPKVNNFALSKRILVSYMQDPEAEYAIIDLSPMYMRSARLRFEKLISTLENILLIKKEGSKEIKRLTEERVENLEKALDEIYEKCTFIDPSELLRKCIDVRNMCGEILEVYSATLPVEQESFDTTFRKILDDYMRLWTNINMLEEKVLEYRFSLSEREDEQYRNIIKLCKTELRNVKSSIEKVSKELEEIMMEREYYVKMLEELINELKLLTK